jgi:phosphoenolpyruvate-protein kinase (PTS system EI component)
MAERVLAGTAASPGLALGAADPLQAPPAQVAPAAPAFPGGEAAAAAASLDAAARELEALSASLRARGLAEEAEVVATGALMAEDPTLRERVAALCAEGLSAAAAVVAATDEAAATLAAIPDELLAARADDVRSLGRRAARVLAGAEASRPVAGPRVIVASDLGPADVAELGDDVAAIVLAAGGVTAHAAIVARSLGIPMVVGVGAFDVEPGSVVVVDGDAGEVVLAPDAVRVARAAAACAARVAARAAAVADRALPAQTADGRRLRVLANVTSAAEVRSALECGAEGAGLIRTELAFLDVRAWPSEEQHRRSLAPLLEALDGRTATVRVLDYGGDKTPPFLAGDDRRGIELLLGAPEALGAQLRAAVAAAGGSELRILLPMVRGASDVAAAAALLGTPRPALGAMIETPEAARAADELADAADFLSIGTNDLTHATLETDRFSAGEAVTHDPRVLAHIAAACAAAHRAGKVIEVCGEAASSPLTVPLLVGLGIDELSVGAARVGTVRAWIRALRHDEARGLAERALAAHDAADVAALVAPVAERLALLERGDAAGQHVDGVGGVAALRA